MLSDWVHLLMSTPYGKKNKCYKWLYNSFAGWKWQGLAVRRLDDGWKSSNVFAHCYGQRWLYRRYAEEQRKVYGEWNVWGWYEAKKENKWYMILMICTDSRL